MVDEKRRAHQLWGSENKKKIAHVRNFVSLSLSFWLFFCLSRCSRQTSRKKQGSLVDVRIAAVHRRRRRTLCVSSCFASVLMIHWTLTNERLLFAATFHGGPFFWGLKPPSKKIKIRQKSSKRKSNSARHPYTEKCFLEFHSARAHHRATAASPSTRYQLGLGQFLWWVALMNLWPASCSSLLPRDFHPTTHST